MQSLDQRLLNWFSKSFTLFQNDQLHFIEVSNGSFFVTPLNLIWKPFQVTNGSYKKQKCYHIKKTQSKKIKLISKHSLNEFKSVWRIISCLFEMHAKDVLELHFIPHRTNHLNNKFILIGWNEWWRFLSLNFCSVAIVVLL